MRRVAAKFKASGMAKSLPATLIGGGAPFLKVKWLFGYGKVRYRGLAKNTQRFVLLLGKDNPPTADSRQPTADSRPDTVVTGRNQPTEGLQEARLDCRN